MVKQSRMPSRARTPRRYGYGAIGAHWEESENKRLLSLHTEERSYRLNRSGMNKIVRSTSFICAASVRAATYMFKLAIVAAVLPDIS
jgi:hypothetical protein